LDQQIRELSAIRNLAAERVGQDQQEGFQRSSFAQQDCVGRMRF